MAVEVVLNDCSCNGQAGSAYVARQQMTSLLTTIRHAFQSGCSRTVRANQHLNDYCLAPNYTVSQWRNDPAVAKEEKLYFSTIATKIPVNGEIPVDVDEDCQVTDVAFMGHAPSLSVKIAYLMEGILVSLRTDNKWDAFMLDIEVHQLTGEGVVLQKMDIIRNASLPDHIVQHRTWFDQRKLQDVSTPADLWAKREELFPSFTFQLKTRPQILGLDARRVKAVRKALDLMATNLYHPGLNVHKYDEISGDNGEEVFEAYAENKTPGAYRIFFHYNANGGLTIVDIVPHPEY